MRSLVVRRAALGDFVLTLPVLAALAARGPVHVATHARYGALLPPGAIWVDDGWLWRGEAPPTPYTDAFAFGGVAADALAATGARVHAVAPRPPPGMHAAAHFARVLGGLPGFDVVDPVPRVAAPRAAGPPSPGPGPVVIAPGSGGREKRWPMARWLAFADALGGAEVLWVRGPDEVDEPGWPPTAVAPDLPGLIALAAAARAWMGADAGPSHLAAAVRAGSGTADDVHVVFGPSDPRAWAPVGATIWPWDTEPAALAAAFARV